MVLWYVTVLSLWSFITVMVNKKRVILLRTLERPLCANFHLGENSHWPASHACTCDIRRAICWGCRRHPPVTNQQRAHTPRKLGFTLCCHSNTTGAPITNPPNSAQLGGSFYHPPPCYIRVRAVVWAYGRRQTHIETDTQMRVTTIHFASSTTHAQCNHLFIGCVLSPFLFLIVIDFLIRRTVDARDSGITWGTGKLTDMDFADDIALISNSPVALQNVTSYSAMQLRLGYGSVQ